MKLRCEDAPMLEHTEQLLADLAGEAHEAEDEDDEAGPSLEDIEDDFIQSSDEEDDAMDHWPTHLGFQSKFQKSNRD